MNMTLDVMAHSLVYWTQDLVAKDLLEKRRPNIRDDFFGEHPGLADLRRGLRRKGFARIPLPAARPRACTARSCRKRRARRRDGYACFTQNPGQ